MCDIQLLEAGRCPPERMSWREASPHLVLFVWEILWRCGGDETFASLPDLSWCILRLVLGLSSFEKGGWAVDRQVNLDEDLEIWSYHIE